MIFVKGAFQVPRVLILFMAAINFSSAYAHTAACSALLAAWSEDFAVLKKAAIELRNGKRPINIPHYEAQVNYYGGAAFRLENNSNGLNKWALFIDGADGRLEINALQVIAGELGLAALISNEPSGDQLWRLFTRNWVSPSQTKRNIPNVSNEIGTKDQIEARLNAELKPVH